MQSAIAPARMTPSSPRCAPARLAQGEGSPSTTSEATQAQAWTTFAQADQRQAVSVDAIVQSVPSDLGDRHGGDAAVL